MERRVKYIFVWIMTTIMFITTSYEIMAEREKSNPLKLPNNVLSIEKTNTFPNPSEEMEIVEPSPFTKQLLEEVDEAIENPYIIKMLNESAVKTTPFSFGFEASIYLGRWPLHYKSESSAIIWDYAHINTNELNNQGNDEAQQVKYNQKTDQVVKGALMNKIKNQDTIKKLILEKVQRNVKYSVAFETRVGSNTKLNNVYNVSPKKIGVLEAYVPAVNEKGQVVYADIYVKSKGSHVSLDVKNITKHGIGAWIPIQDHVSLTYNIK